MKEIEELMKPRWKVIAGYPYCPYEIGDLVEITDLGTSFHCTTTREWNAFTETLDDSVNYFSISVFETWLHLFKKLAWWEERSIEDLPKYVKIVQPDYHYSVQEAYKWDIGIGYVKTKEWDAAQSLKIFEPATFEEHQSHKSINSLK